MMTTSRLTLFSLWLQLALAPVCAASSIAVSSPAADGVFLLQGEAFDRVAGLELSISYDGGTLSNPRVATGALAGDMMSVVNPGNPIRMVLVGAGRSIDGSGPIASISFQRTGSSPGRITAVNATMIGADGRKVPLARTSITNPSIDQPITEPVRRQAQFDPSSPGTVELPEGAGNAPEATPPPDIPPPGTEVPDAGQPMEQPQQEQPQQEQPQQEQPESAEQPQDVPGGEAAQPPGTAGEPGQGPGGGTGTAATGSETPTVLQRFAEFKGERTVDALVALFDAPAGTGNLSQSPPIVISDGKATAIVSIRNVPGDATPRFVFQAATFVSLAKVGEREWEVTVRPDAGAVKASVGILTATGSQELPLTVAPPAPLAGKPGPISREDFAFFLKERGTEAAPKYDLDGDGKRDYVDDYIFAANYLVKVERKAPGKESPAGAH